MIKKTAALLAVATGLSGLSHAAIFNEADAPYNGDFENVLLDLDPSNDVLMLASGSHSFIGSIVTPGDQGDVVVVRLESYQSITGVSIDFGTNSDPFNPIAINQNTRFLLLDNDEDPLVAQTSLTGVGTFGLGPLATPGGQVYSLQIVSEVLALLNGAVGYTFTVMIEGSAPPPPPPPPTPNEVPIPAAALLFGSVVAGLGLRSKKRRDR